ncbi:hypothetical protein Mapa_012959 [Marchantia paleacea]|nr:hypothetical protein Mapa_012959 [Marchantia paleacea]
MTQRANSWFLRTDPLILFRQFLENSAVLCPLGQPCEYLQLTSAGQRSREPRQKLLGQEP